MKKLIRLIGLLLLVPAIGAGPASAEPAVERLLAAFSIKIMAAFPDIPHGECYETWVRITKDSPHGGETLYGLTGECSKADLIGSVWNFRESYLFTLSESELLEQRFAMVADPSGYLVLVDHQAYLALPGAGPQERITASIIKDDVLKSAFMKALKAAQEEADKRRYERMRQDIEKKFQVKF